MQPEGMITNDQDMIIYNYDGVPNFHYTVKIDHNVNCQLDTFQVQNACSRGITGKRTVMYIKKLFHFGVFECTVWKYEIL